MMRVILLLAFMGTTVALMAQNTDTLNLPGPPASESGVEIYHSSSGELIFSLGDVNVEGAEDPTNTLRFSFFFHLQEQWNFDFNDNFGIRIGAAIRNVGFNTVDDPIRIQEHEEFVSSDIEGCEKEVDYRRRAYSLGAPVDIKLGRVKNGAFFFGGIEPELMFHYKERLFVNGDKDNVLREWFSDKINLFNPSVYAGVQFKQGINIKLKYYLNDFLNTEYEETVNGQLRLPYQNVESRLFYISISAGLNPRNRKESRFPGFPEDRT
jgi:hypothetical protein